MLGRASSKAKLGGLAHQPDRGGAADLDLDLEQPGREARVEGHRMACLPAPELRGAASISSSYESDRGSKCYELGGRVML